MLPKWPTTLPKPDPRQLQVSNNKQAQPSPWCPVPLSGVEPHQHPWHLRQPSQGPGHNRRGKPPAASAKGVLSSETCLQAPGQLPWVSQSGLLLGFPLGARPRGELGGGIKGKNGAPRTKQPARYSMGSWPQPTETQPWPSPHVKDGGLPCKRALWSARSPRAGCTESTCTQSSRCRLSSDHTPYRCTP